MSKKPIKKLTVITLAISLIISTIAFMTACNDDSNGQANTFTLSVHHTGTGAGNTTFTGNSFAISSSYMETAWEVTAGTSISIQNLTSALPGYRIREIYFENPQGVRIVLFSYQTGDYPGGLFLGVRVVARQLSQFVMPSHAVVIRIVPESLSGSGQQTPPIGGGNEIPAGFVRHSHELFSIIHPTQLPHNFQTSNQRHFFSNNNLFVTVSLGIHEEAIVYETFDEEAFLEFTDDLFGMATLTVHDFKATQINGVNAVIAHYNFSTPLSPAGVERRAVILFTDTHTFEFTFIWPTGRGTMSDSAVTEWFDIMMASITIV